MKLYRIYNTQDRTMWANAIPTLELAKQHLEFLALDYPEYTFAIESYAA